MKNAFETILVILFFLFIALVVFPTFDNEQPKPVVEPDRVIMYEGKRCAVYDGRFRGAPMFVLLCEDDSIHFTKDWIYVK